MLKQEKKLLEWIEKHMLLVLFIAVSIMGILVRATFMNFQSGDFNCFLSPWYNEIKSLGGLKALKQQVGDYNIFYQFLIAVMSYIPVKALYAYKLLSIVFDWLLAFAVGKMVYDISEDRRNYKALLAYSAILMSPMVILNSSAWAQCDSMYTFFVVMALISILKDKYVRTFIFLGVAFALKLQTIFIIPFVLIVYLVKKRFSILHFAIIPVVMIVMAMPGIVMGRSIADVFTIYFNQTDTYQYLSCNYPSFWVILANQNNSIVVENYDTLAKPAILFTIVVLAVIATAVVVKKVKLNARNMIYLAFITAYTCVMFLPAMHERYGFIYEILALVIVFMNKKTIPLCIALWGISLKMYGHYLYSSVSNIGVLTVMNVLLYSAYLIVLIKNMMKESDIK